jgi:hypothetical protein
MPEEMEIKEFGVISRKVYIKNHLINKKLLEEKLTIH